VTCFTISGQSHNQKAKEFYDSGCENIKVKDYNKAIADFTDAIKLDSGFIQAYENRGVAKFYMHNNRGAAEDYTLALKINPNDYNTLGRRGWARFFMLDYEGAVEDLTRAIKGSNDRAKFYNVRGEARFHLNDYKGALSDFNQVIKSWSSGRYNRSKAFYLKGLVEIERGEKDTGCADLSKALKLGYSDASDAMKDYCKK
jgi:serine/threonine-protein kinase